MPLNLSLPNCLEVVLPLFNDHRGQFLNLFRYNDQIFVDLWGSRPIRQLNLSKTFSIGSIRGLHLQKAPFYDAKLITCVSGRVWDVAVDLRPNSPTYLDWTFCILDSSLHNSFFIPEGFAHGFQVLQSNSQLVYLHSCDWHPESETGCRFDDPALGIEWPMSPSNISERDLNFPPLL